MFTHSSPTCNVSYLFRRKVVNVCAMSPGDVIIRPCSSLMLRMVLSASLCCLRKMLYMVGCSPSSLSASSLSMRIVFSLSLWSLPIFAFRRLSVGRFAPLAPYDVIRHIYTFIIVMFHVSLVSASLRLFRLEELPDSLLTVSIAPHIYVREVWFLLCHCSNVFVLPPCFGSR